MKMFNVLRHREVSSDCPKQIPWLLVAAYEERAQENHQQSLEGLHRRGGLDPVELWLLCHNLPLYGHDAIPTMERATKWLRNITPRIYDHL